MCVITAARPAAGVGDYGAAPYQPAAPPPPGPRSQPDDAEEMSKCPVTSLQPFCCNGSGWALLVWLFVFGFFFSQASQCSSQNT